MKRSIENVTKSDDTSQPAKIANQQPGSDALRSSSDTPENLESASNTKNSLATSFAQQESVLTAEQIESLKGFDKEGVGIILDKIARDACRGHPGALNAISQELASCTKEELIGIFQISYNTLKNIAHAAGKGHPDALNAISTKLRSFTKKELIGIFQASSHTLDNISWAACEGHPDALNAISRQFENFCKDELKTIFAKKTNTLGRIALAACKGYPDALNAISVPLANFNLAELSTSLSSYSVENIASAAGQGHTDAFHAILSPLVGVMDLKNRAWRERYCWFLRNAIKPCIFEKPNNRFLGLERAFCNLDETTFSRITNGASSKIISQLEKSINWYKEFSVIFNQSSSDQVDMSGAILQVQENLSARLCRFINDKVLQMDGDQTSRESRIDFVKNLCDYLNMMGHHHIVLDLSNICRTYQSGLDGYYCSTYADSVLDEFSGSLVQQSETSFFAVRQESDSERDKRYKKAYGMLKSFNENLGLWIQFEQGRDPLSAQDTVVEHFKVLLRAYKKCLSDGYIDAGLDYEQVNEALTENNWSGFKSIIKDFMIEPGVNEASSTPMPSSHRP